jgi:hypothetical protein
MIEHMFVSDPLARVAAGVGDLLAEDWNEWNDAALSEQLTGMLDQLERLHAAVMSCAASWDGRGVWAVEGAPTPQSWLVENGSMTRPSATRLARTARHLRGHERTAKALFAGDVKVEHVEAIAIVARGREELARRHEDALLGAARRVKPDDFVRVARRWAELADDVIAKKHAKKNWERRHLHVSPTTGGGRIDGFVDPEATAIVTAALDALMPPDPKDGPEPPRTLSQRRADALVEMCQRSLGGTAPSARARANVDIVIDADTAAGVLPSDLLDARCDIQGGGPLSKVAVERILCDSAVGYAVVRRPLAHDLARQASEVLDLGRRTREPSPAQRRAVHLRDEHCRYPGCRAPLTWCDIHHMEPWEHGGGTDLDNLVALCRRHHVTVHEGGHRLIRGPDGGIIQLA